MPPDGHLFHVGAFVFWGTPDKAKPVVK